MKKTEQTGRHILMAWDSENNGFQVTVTAIEKLRVDHNIQISEVIYLQNKDLNEGNQAELKAFQMMLGNESFPKKNQKIEELKNSLTLRGIANKTLFDRIDYAVSQAELILQMEADHPIITQKRLNISHVTDYQSIYDTLVNFLKSWMGKLDFTHDYLHINVSSGTPQMHVVWLMLNSSGYLPDNTRLWSSQIDRRTQKHRLEPIHFKPRTYLNEILEENSAAKRPAPNVNPNDLRSEKRRKSIDLIELYAPVSAPLLILGERGVGKSTLVREHLHRKLNPKVPFRELACGTFREELFRSELFGYKKGAFTGATADKKGILDEFKDHGILFLDEIHDLSPSLQREIIQVLQTSEYYPIGSTEPQTANFRLVTASNRSLSELVQPHVLAPDFFDRIAHVHLTVPPIRECREDIHHFWIEVYKGISKSKEFKAPWNEKLEKFLKVELFPGNFRDLERLAARIHARILNKPLSSDDLAIQLGIEDFAQFSRELTLQSAQKSYFQPDLSFDIMEGRFRKDLVTWAENHYGSINQAAQALGRKASTLYQDRRWKENQPL